MKYLGGKSKLAKHIVPILVESLRKRPTFVEPFCGGCSITSRVAEELGPEIVQASDVNPYLITLWKAVAKGWMPPATLSWSEYTKHQNNPQMEPITAYAATALSFGGKWFGGYAEGGFRLYDEEAYKAACVEFPKLRGVSFTLADYSALEVPTNSTVYCDPPYLNTTKYVKDSFDTTKFWAWCEGLASKGCKVFVSEKTCPLDWGVVWSKERKSSVGANRKPLLEKLFSNGV